MTVNAQSWHQIPQPSQPFTNVEEAMKYLADLPFESLQSHSAFMQSFWNWFHAGSQQFISDALPTYIKQHSDLKDVLFHRYIRELQSGIPDAIQCAQHFLVFVKTQHQISTSMLQEK